jgi:opacity protein-like surface antigen
MIKLKTLIAGMFAALMLASISLAQELPKSEVSLQGIGSFTNDTTGNGVRQHTTDSGGLLASYRYHFNRWFAADGSYGYTRGTYQNFMPAGSLGVQSNVHQITGALVATLPQKLLLFRPYALAGAGVLNFDPTGNNFFPGSPLTGASSQNKGAFLYGAGTDIDLNDHFAIRLEYRGLVYDRPDFGFASLNSGRTTHTAQPSAGFVFRF